MAEKRAVTYPVGLLNRQQTVNQSVRGRVMARLVLLDLGQSDVVAPAWARCCS
jgi:hypothetical protein